MKLGDVIEGNWWGEHVKLEAKLRDEAQAKLGFYCSGCYFNRGTGVCGSISNSKTENPRIQCWTAENGGVTHFIFKEA